MQLIAKHCAAMCGSRTNRGKYVAETYLFIGNELRLGLVKLMFKPPQTRGQGTPDRELSCHE